MAPISLLLCAILATAAPTTRYAVLPFTFSPPHRELQWLTEAFALSVADRLEMLGLTVATRRERVEVAATGNLASASPATLASRLKLGRALRSDRSVTGFLALEPSGGDDPARGQLVVTMVIIDVKEDRFLHRRTLRGTMNELFSMMDEIALEAAWHDPVPPGPEARQTLKTLKDPPLPVFEAVMKAIVEKDPERQAALTESATVMAREHPLMLRRLADALIEAGRVEEGLGRLLALDPANQPDPWRLHLDIAEILLERQEIDAAALRTAQSIAARDTAPAHMLLARIALLRGDLPGASREAKRAAAIDPDSPGLASILQGKNAPQ